MEDCTHQLDIKSNETSETKKVYCVDSYVIVHICFGVNFAFLLVHVATLVYFKKARRFYGFGYFLGQIFLSVSALLTLVCCSLDVESRAFGIILITANFGYLVNLSAQTLSVIVVFLSTIQPDSSHHPVSRFRKTWATALGLFCIFGVPISMTIQHSLGVANKARFRPVRDIGSNEVVDLPSGGVSHCVVCSFVHNDNTLYFLLTPAVLLLLIQFTVICITIRLSSPSENLGKEMKRQRKFAALLKTCLGQLLVWGLALVALVTTSNILWNVFTLCTALQSIFSTTACILSRSVVGAALAQKHQSSGDTMNYPNTLHHWINEKDREMLYACQYKLTGESDRFYY